MLRVCAVLLCVGFSGPVWADARITVLMDVMHVDEVIDILHAEGLAHGARLNEEMLDGQGGPVWVEQISDLYDRDHMQAGLRNALASGLAADDIAAATAFYASEVGAGIISSENQARRVMSDQGIETAARELATQTKDDNPDVYAKVTSFIEINGLIENNVSGAMSQQYRFLKGLSDGGLNTRSDDALLDDVWAMRDPIEADTREWLYSYLVLAYLPLPPEDFDAYLAFSATPAGQALNAALFAGFDSVYRDISYGLGRAVALHATSDEI